MEPETRATSFEKDAPKTKDNAPKGKTRSNSLFSISSGFTFFALPGGSSSSSFRMTGLRSFEPRRRSLDFKILDTDFADEFYEIIFNELYVEIFAIAHSAFHPGDIPKPPRTSLWLREYPEEFLKYVELVAYPDARAGAWGRLLSDGNERVNLITAIIYQVLDKKVFSALLFGASSGHDEALKKIDTALINVEGFQRSSLRSHTTRTWLRMSNGEPPRFWEEVDKLCTQMMTMLLPLFAYAKGPTNSDSIPVSELYQLYQALHDVIAFAGWASVCIRMSPTIVSMDWTRPGEPFSMDLVNNCQEAYEASKRAAHDYHARLGNFISHDKTFASPARVKISVTPRIVRHKPNPKSMATQGVNSYTLMEPHVVFYQGFYDKEDESRAFISLRDYIQMLRDRNCVPHYTAVSIIAVALFSLLTWLVWHFSLVGQLWRMVQGEVTVSGQNHGPWVMEDVTDTTLTQIPTIAG
ncbi:hypothetical protein NW768_002934 [Fusarium equiseti]|uniref:Uncharacterized protein n=1 Tax=Fusarium equiseti TaxID=61235 RepID=A0ABQ8RKH5_FUSEQ|nr:hypothetical protein NW768_002934 [Fusarium equiseti]